MAPSPAGRLTPRRGSTGWAGRTRRGGARTSGRSPTSSSPRCCARWGMARTRGRCWSRRSGGSGPRGGRREANRFVAGLLALRDGLLGALVGYGRRPLRAFAWLAGVWLFGAGVFWLAFQHGAMRPAQAGALASAGWTRLRRGPGPRRRDGLLSRERGRAALPAVPAAGLFGRDAAAGGQPRAAGVLDTRSGSGRRARLVDAGVSVGAHARGLGAGAVGDRRVLRVGEVGLSRRRACG